MKYVLVTTSMVAVVLSQYEHWRQQYYQGKTRRNLYQAIRSSLIKRQRAPATAARHSAT